MATRQQGWLRRASTRLTRLMTATGGAIAGAVRFATPSGVAFAHWLKRSSTEAMRSGSNTLAAVVPWVRRIISTDDDVVVIVNADETEVENLGTQQVPINLPKINTKRDLVLFDDVGQF